MSCSRSNVTNRFFFLCFLRLHFYVFANNYDWNIFQCNLLFSYFSTFIIISLLKCYFYLKAPVFVNLSVAVYESSQNLSIHNDNSLLRCLCVNPFVTRHIKC